MKRERNPRAKRRKIIDAAHQVLRDGGYFKNFTIDKVAEISGVSKGGVLHHFPTKDALVSAATHDVNEQFINQLDKEMDASDGPRAGSMTRSYVNLLMDPTSSQKVFELSPLLLSYINDTQDADQPKQFEYWQARTEADGVDVLTATIVRLAADGLAYNETIDNKPIPATLKEQLWGRLLQMLDEASKTEAE